MDIECKDEYEQESGQIVIQKTFPGVYKALSLAYFFQSKPELYFKLLLGDKDTFRYAWRALNFSYHLVTKINKVRPNLGVLGTLESNQVCGSSMVQFSPTWGSDQYGPPPPPIVDSQPLVTFVHMNMQKERSELTNFDVLQTFNPPIQNNGVGEIFWGHNHACTKLLPPINSKDGEQLGLLNSDFKQMFPNLADDFTRFFNEIQVVEEIVPIE